MLRDPVGKTRFESERKPPEPGLKEKKAMRQVSADEV